MILTSSTGATQTWTAFAVAAGMVLTVGTALGFEHIGGYIPCMLCLEQRIPYYFGIPVMLAAAISAALRGPALLIRGLLLAGGALMLWGIYLGAYHAGVEWAWWEGPANCGALPSSASGGGSGGVLGQLNQVVPPSCDQAAGRFLGLSFAGWNVVASATLATLALRGAFAKG